MWMVLGWAAAWACTPEALDAAAAASEAAIEAGDGSTALQEAEKRFACAQTLETGRGEAAYALAILQEQLGVDATASFRAATQLLPAGPDRSSAWLRIGLYAAMAGDPQGLVWLEKAVDEAGPAWQVVESNIWLARVLAKSGDPERSLSILDGLEPQTPDEEHQIRSVRSLAWSSVMHARRAVGDIPGAIEAAESSLEVLGEAPEGPDPNAEDRSMAEFAVGQRLLEAGRPAVALPVLERAQEQFASTETPSLGDAFASSALSEALRQLGRADEALALANRAVDVSTAVLGPDHPDTASFAIRQGSVLSTLGRLAEADAAYERAETGLTAALGTDHPEVLFVQHDRLRLAFRRGVLGPTLAGVEALLARSVRVRGPDHLDTIETAKLRCELLGATGRDQEAAACATAARDALQALLGPHPNVMKALAAEGEAWMDAGQPVRGRARLREALAMQEALATVAPDPAWTATLKVLLARAELALGQWEAAHDLLGDRPPDGSPSLAYAWHLTQANRLVERHPDAAIPYLKRAMEAAPSRTQKTVVMASWGFALLRQGDPIAARRLLEDALAGVEPTRPVDEATIRLHLMQAYQSTGDRLRALEQLNGIRAATKRAGLDVHPTWILAQTELASMLYDAYPEDGVALLAEAEEMAQAAGPNSSELATVHQTWVELYLRHPTAHAAHPADHPVSFAAASRHADAAIAILSERYGPRHRRTLQARYTAAAVESTGPAAKEALQALRAVDADIVETFGPESLERGAVLTALALVEQSHGDERAALDAATRALDLQEKRLDMLLTGSERQRMAALAEGRGQLTIYLSLEPDAEAAYARGLAWKGLAGRAFLGGRSASPELARVRRSLAELAFAPPGDLSPEALRDQLAALTERKEALESSVRTTTTKVRWKAQCRLLDDDEAVVDWFPGFANGERVLEAFVLRGGDCTTVHRVALDADEVQVAHAKYRRVMASRGAARLADRVSAMVREALWDPLEPLLDGRTRVTLIPDASLADISFAGLATPDGGYLVERYELTTLEHLADLGVHAAPVSLDAALVVGGVAYSSGDSTQAVASRSMRAGCSWSSFGDLPGALTEAEAVGALLSERGTVSVLTGAVATEDAVRAGMPGASVVHLATHGFHASPECRLDAFFEPLASGLSSHALVGMNPMLASGLALAGVNDRSSDSGDGLLTAEEVAATSVDADLVVLSACESGLGEVAPGEGVQGLQRGFRAAVADRVVFSLWQVPDEATRQLMEAFYAGLAEGKRPGAALREAQLSQLERNRSERGSGDASDWAAFVVGG
jgi:CHAT domain-containing protein/tetratricopeptide (TPR) repeat protein